MPSPCPSTDLDQLSSATKVGAIVAGQTSVKAPERIAFEQHLPEDVHIVSCHSMHGPTVPTKGQPLVCGFPSPNRNDKSYIMFLLRL